MKLKAFRAFGLAAIAALLLASCGGGGDSNPPLVTFSRMVSFGDSLSDVGSYRTPAVAAAYGGGKYTINDIAGGTDKIWTERIAQALGLPAQCAAQTGLESSGPFAALAAPVTNVPDCYSYAQGGSRVTNPVGPWNKGLLLLTPPDPRGYLGQLTKPVVEQIQRHLAASGGAFAADNLVAVAAGGDDVFENLVTVASTVAAGGNATAAGQAAVAAMAQAGGELAAYIKALIVGKGAKQVVVLTLPDVGETPDSAPLDQPTRDLLEMMSFTFNAYLVDGVKGVPEVLLVDGYALFRDVVRNPARYGLDNATEVACADFPPAGRPYSLFCSTATLKPGVDPSRLAFADGSHPSPKGSQIIADAALAAMRQRGWAPAD
jgi:phospholipase/lecithinase/hemolysin